MQLSRFRHYFRFRFPRHTTYTGSYGHAPPFLLFARCQMYLQAVCIENVFIR